MKVTKYKAFDKKRKMMGLVEGLHWGDLGQLTMVNLLLDGEVRNRYYGNAPGAVDGKLKDVVLLQFTGKKDKAKKEIYAGDILFYEEEPDCEVYVGEKEVPLKIAYYVKYDEDRACFSLWGKHLNDKHGDYGEDWHPDLIDLEDAGSLQVLGNIHENSKF